jgi:tetratricopeptide (TPR) repeat protein
MKKFTHPIILLFALGMLAFPQHADHPAPTAASPIRLLETKGFVHKKVSTTNIEAQKYFDQGLTLLYAYNSWDAARSFKRASELDPSLAIAWWGVSAATFPRSGASDHAEKMKEAMAAIGLAKALEAPPSERVYVDAFARRFSDAEKPDRKALDADYAVAMKKIYEDSPNDPDAAILYHWSRVPEENLGGWKKRANPSKGALEGERILEDAMKKHPGHLGLNHEYIHQVESSLNPERALRSADLLRSFKLSEPELGHLVHMPAHIYVRVGDFQKAAESNLETARNVKVQIGSEFGKWHYNHVYSFLRLSYYMQGNYEKVRFNDLASFDHAYPNPTANDKQMRGNDLSMMLRFGRWKDVLEFQISEPYPNVYSARAFALAATGNVAAAEEEEKKYLAACKCGLDPVIPEGAEQWDADGKRVSAINVRRLAAKIASAKGNNDRALEHLQKAVIIQDEIAYNEPPRSIEPARINLGGLLLRMGRFAEAEKTFREDLVWNRGNGRSLFGLMKALEGQNKSAQARQVEREFRKAWQYADTELRVEDL